jgi:serine/threonine protein kinase
LDVFLQKWHRECLFFRGEAICTFSALDHQHLDSRISFVFVLTGPIGFFARPRDSDQVFKIFQRRGTPTGEMWPGVLRLPHYNAEFPQWRERPITDFVSMNSLGGPAGVDLLSKLLQYDPDRRIACKAALQHAFFMQE